MTSNVFSSGQRIPRRRATFIPSAPELAARRLHVVVAAAAVVVSTAAVGVIAPFVF